MSPDAIILAALAAVAVALPGPNLGPINRQFDLKPQLED